jgi:fumarate reductase subunit C
LITVQNVVMLSVTVHSIMTFKEMTPSIMKLHIKGFLRPPNLTKTSASSAIYAECYVLLITMQNVVMLSVIMTGVLEPFSLIAVHLIIGPAVPS